MRSGANMTAMETLTGALLRGLNREIAPGLLLVVFRLYKDNTGKDKFASAMKALGFSDSLSRSIYVYINENIGILDAESNTYTTSRKPALRREHKPARKTEASSGKRKLKLDLDLDLGLDPEGSVEDLDLDAGLQNVIGGNVSKTEDGDIELDLKEEKKEVLPKKITFKKIKKEDARRMKQRGDRELKRAAFPNERVHPKALSDSSAKKEVEPSNSDVRKDDPDAATITQEIDKFTQTDTTDDNVDDTMEGEDIENDREWYAVEDSTTAAVDHYLDLEQAYKPHRKYPVHRQIQRSGGGFDSLGEYRDYDHDEARAQSRSRIPILAHFIVPPFLKGSENHLTLQIDLSRTSRSIGPRVDPIKDPESELAVAARTGSAIIRERKEKQERAKQAKDRVSSNATDITVGAGAGPNPAENKRELRKPDPAPYSFDSIQQQRRSLPAFQVRAELLQAIAENQIVVIVGETGSGKTTQIAQFLVEEGYTKSLRKDSTRRLVACTQPRRVAAMTVAKRVAEEMGVPLGADVGYTIRFEDRTSRDHTRLKYMTEGILLREFLQDPLLEQYACIIMDEAHERSLNTDVLLGLFRDLVRRRRDLKLVVTSATMNAERFARYFGNAPQFFIPGRTFPVEVFYAKSRCSDYVETAVKQVVTIHLANQRGDGDILVFMTGQEDIEATCEMIHEKLSLLENPPPLDVFPIYSSLPADTQRKIFMRQSPDRRKVVVATNIAETSLTVDGIRYVVDCGLVKMKMFNPKLGMDALQMVPISMANAQQRSGRAGRTQSGIAYRLFTEHAALPEQMFAQPVPEIQRTNLSAMVLTLKSLGVENITRFPFLDPPPPDLLTCSLYELWAMGALESLGKLTPLGRKMTAFPMEPTLAKLIILACQDEFHCAAEILTIVAMLSVPSVFYRPKERADDADAMRERFLVADLDHLTLLNVYTQWEQRAAKTRNNTPWCSRNFLHHKSLVRAKEVRTQLAAIMVKLKYPMLRARSDADIRRCICAAYFHQLASLEKMAGGGGGKGHALYSNLRQPYMKMHLHPTSALVGGTDISPQYVVYDELVLTKKEYMQCVTAVELEWLLQYGYVFYGVSARVKRELETERGIKLNDPSELERHMYLDQTEAERSIQETSTAKARKSKAVPRNF